MEEDKRDRLARFHYETHLRLMKLKESEGFSSVDSAVQSLLDSRAGATKVTLTVGTCQVWSRAV